MTLIYCAWASPKEIFNIEASNDMNACSIVLYIITERLPYARKYRDVYETIKLMVTESIEENQYEARGIITRLRPYMQDVLHTISSGQDEQDGLWAMMFDMAGEPSAMIAGASWSAPTDCSKTASPPPAGSNIGLPLDGIPLDFQKTDTYDAMDLQLGTIFLAPDSEWMANI